MPASPRYIERLDRFLLPLCLLLQACLLLPRLDLLPAWGDEHFTLLAASRPLAGVIRTISEEKNNPPLHTLLVHFWLLIPWPVAAIVAARALSVLTTLAATVTIDALWARQLEPRGRRWFLLLWACSPCLLLYGRMARSYALQVLVFGIALRAAMELLDGARRAWRIVFFALASSCLLYVHYLPGLALLGSVVAIAAWRAMRTRHWRTAAWTGVSVALAGVLYYPWLWELWVALGRMVQAQPRPGAANPLATEALRLGYWLFSFSVGETPPTWALVGALAISPALAYLLWKGLRPAPAWLPLAVPTAVAAYLGASRWLSFVFIPARLLFLLPFFLLLLVRGAERSRRAGWIACGSLAVLSAGSVASYFQRTDFLDKAYLLPYPEIARTINENSTAGPAVVVADACNLDPGPLTTQVRSGIPVILVTCDSGLAALRQRLNAPGADTIWYVRNTHDISRGGLNSKLEAELSAVRRVETRLYVPYSQRDRFLMGLLGWRERPTHFVQLLEMRRP